MGELCRNRGRKAKVYNVGFHAERDLLAYALNADVEPGLVYRDGSPVKRPWIVTDKARKRDGCRSVHFRRPGAQIPMLWASTRDSGVWYAAQWKANTQHATYGGTSAIDLLAGIVEPHTVWAEPC